MKFAIINDSKVEATSGAKGKCPGCESEVIAKCGDVKMHHWAHKGDRHCDPWWEETEWHRAWKGLFSVDCQEVRQQAENGEWHIADVKTNQGWVLEFQHSSIKAEERRARNAFYHPKLAWIVDGTRRKRDKAQFFKMWEEGHPVSTRLRLIYFPDECTLMREWADNLVPVFFDFGGVEQLLWCLVPRGSHGKAYVVAFTRVEFLGYHGIGETQEGQDFTGILQMIDKTVSANILSREAKAKVELIGFARRGSFLRPPGRIRSARSFRRF